MSVESMVKLPVLELVPPGPSTVIGPVDAPAGTTAPMVVLLVTTKLAAGVPLNRTAVALVKLTPVMVTFVPGKPCVGAKLVTAGGAKKTDALVAVPPGVVTLIVPVLIPAGTTAPMVVLFVTVNPAAGTPLKVTALALVKLLPLIRTMVPGPPPTGAKLEMLGGR